MHHLFSPKRRTQAITHLPLVYTIARDDHLSTPSFAHATQVLFLFMRISTINVLNKAAITQKKKGFVGTLHTRTLPMKVYTSLHR
jgi:hypothetical protein